MDRTKIKEKLSQLRSQTSKSNSFWKPKSGKSTIRILPYKFSEDKTDFFPFVEMWFHYDLGLKNAPVSLETFGKPDPIVEMSETLKKSGDKTEYAMGKKIQPKMRIYAPILVRGEESEGPKIWAFGKEVYTALLELVDNPEYDKIWDIQSGTDIVISFQTAKEAGRNFPKTTIQPMRNVTVATKDKTILKRINEEVPNIYELYKDRTFDYEGLSEILKKWLEGGDVTEEKKTEETESINNLPEETVISEDDTTEETIKDVNSAADAFDELFYGKKTK